MASIGHHAKSPVSSSARHAASRRSRGRPLAYPACSMHRHQHDQLATRRHVPVWAAEAAMCSRDNALAEQRSWLSLGFRLLHVKWATMCGGVQSAHAYFVIRCCAWPLFVSHCLFGSLAASKAGAKAAMARTGLRQVEML